MSQIQQRIDTLGRRESANLATATTQKVFASVATTPPVARRGINLANCDVAADLYVVLANAGSSAPTVSSSDHDLIVPPKTCRQLLVGPSIDVWVRSSSAGTIAYTASELL
jgi:hypothetical protein